MAIIQWRRATAAEWTAANPVLRQAEAGYEIGTGKFKIGDGSSTWNSLSYFGSGAASFTNNGDGGFTSGAVKLAGYNWVDATFAKIANAVALATTAALPPGIATAGTGTDAARVDHRHPFQAVPPRLLRPSGLWVSDCLKDDGAGQEVGANLMLLRPMPIITPDHQPLVIDGLGVSVVTAGSAGTIFRAGIWGSNPSTGLVDWSSLVTQMSTPADTTGQKKITVSQVSLPEGWYWTGTVMQGGTGAKILGARPDDFIRLYQTDPNHPSQFEKVICFSVGGVSGALPTTPQDIGAVNNAFAGLVWMRAV